MSHPSDARPEKPRAYTREHEGVVYVRIHAGRKWLELEHAQLGELIERLIELDGEAPPSQPRSTGSGQASPVEGEGDQPGEAKKER